MKKIIIPVLTLSLVMAGGWFLISKKSTSVSKTTYSKSSFLAKKPKQKEIIKDTDKDGLKDWEEILWKTDPKNPDTDGDGTSDGEEVRQGRNPLKAGPNDKLVQIKKTNQNFSQKNKETLTAKLGKSLLANYLLLKIPGKALNDEQKKELVNSLLQNINSPTTEKHYSLDDLKTLEDQKTEQIKNYGNQLGGIIVKITSKSSYLPGQELFILKKALETKEDKAFKDLETISRDYLEMAQEIIKIPCPQEFCQAQLKLANSYQEFSRAVNYMKQALKDPVLALVGIKLYQTEANNLYQAYEEFKKLFNQKAITFEENEAGILFLKATSQEINIQFNP